MTPALRTSLFGLLFSALLTACGGGGPTSVAPAPAAPPPTPVAVSGYVWYAGSDRPASAEELDVLRLTNEARAQGARCEASETQPAKTYGPAPALAWNDQLAHAARNHVQDMGQRDYFAHLTPEGVRPRDRVTLAGYKWSVTAENIAAGYPSPADVVSGWLNSPGHCHSLMNPDLRDLGVGFWKDPAPGDKYGVYWGQVFGAQ
ncbi:hypothetical protein GCM10017783_21150 [Deinococcus piscis]|uniref:SCP domain-containing protein n=1 Tax=Deinococcus piscis TaxID=394230 RepID=A0ABQ3K943_9DEIO|nr:CAP domain-containing protein [Deinococcus piscis]GHG08345.1 hypothetical protein GCM10017783_21150 [Deinococcus piscis]